MFDVPALAAASCSPLGRPSMQDQAVFDRGKKDEKKKGAFVNATDYHECTLLTALSDQGNRPPCIFHGADCLEDRESRPAVLTIPGMRDEAVCTRDNLWRSRRHPFRSNTQEVQRVQFLPRRACSPLYYIYIIKILIPRSPVVSHGVISLNNRRCISV